MPGRGTKIPQAMGQLSPAPFNYRAQVLWIPHATTRQRKLRTATTAPARHSEDPACHNYAWI